jgi:hypothetical protein
MNPLRNTLGLLVATIAALAMPPIATAEYLVPPGNSAVTQYTESYPTAGGGKNSEKAGEESPTPAQALGKRNAKRLESQGEDGQAVAEVAAATAPAPEVVTPPPPAAPQGDDREAHSAEKRAHPRPDDGAEPETAAVAGGGNGSSGTGGPDGSSGLGEVLAQATGSSSSGQMGLLLLLVIVAAIAWALAFLWRQRNRSMA